MVDEYKSIFALFYHSSFTKYDYKVKPENFENNFVSLSIPSSNIPVWFNRSVSL